MVSEIGMTAGKVWQFLKTSGPATAAKIQKGIGSNAVLTNQALGWLAREGKLKITRDKQGTQYELTE